MKIRNVLFVECLCIVEKIEINQKKTQGHVESLVKKKFTQVSEKTH